MESRTKKHISWTVTGVVILVLSVTVILQARRINSLAGELNNSHPLEGTANCKAEIDKLKAQIADMQAWQDYLEGALNEKNTDSVSALQNRSAGNRMENNAPGITNNPAMRDRLRSSISFRYDALAEEIGLSEETKSKLMDLLAEMRLEIMDRMPGRGGLPPEMADREAIRQQIEEITSKYNEKISELLSDDELYAFREYQNSEPERMLITGFNGNVFEDDNLLDKETEKELVAAMYSARQADPDTKREDDSASLLGGPFSRLSQMNEGLDNVEKLNSIYLESAKDILSDDQMQKLEDYLNNRQPLFDMRRGPRSDRLPGAE